MRVNYRKSKKNEGLDAASLQIGTADGGVLKLVWDRKYESGNQGIDEQHKKLFKLGNLLLHAILTGWPRANIIELMDKLISEVEHHFASEDRQRTASSGNIPSGPESKVAGIFDRKRLATALAADGPQPAHKSAP